MGQQEMPLIGSAIQPKRVVREYLVRQCRNYRDAVNLCIEEGPFSRDQIAGHLVMHRTSLATILNRGGTEKRRRYLDPDLFELIEDLSGNTAISQYFNMQSEGKLNRQRGGESDEVDLAKELHRQRQLLEQIEKRLEASA